MGGLHFLDLVIGLAFIYFLLSIICLSLQELKANLLNERSKNLEKWIVDTFNVKGTSKNVSDNNIPGLGDRIWKNIIVDGLTQNGRSASYIPKEVFVSALINEIYYGFDESIKEKKDGSNINSEQKIKEEIKPAYDFHSLRSIIENPPAFLPRPFQRVISQVYAESHENIETFRMRLERWFEMAMVRNSGTYKKHAQKFTFVAAVIVTLSMNVDSIKLASHFFDNPVEAKRIADRAEVFINQNQNQDSIDNKELKEIVNTIQADINRINELKLPIGWSNADYSVFDKSAGKIFAAIVSTTAGWIITIFAVSLGAPFWFDTLNKLVNLRAAGKAPNGGNNSTSGDEKKAQHSDTAVG